MAKNREEENLRQIVRFLKLMEKDKRYHPEAYSFIISSLDYTMKKLKRKDHVTGQELSDGIRGHAIEKFGPMARLVLEHWGIKTTDDFGEIVYNLIDAGILGKTEKDSKEDFSNRYNFTDAFDRACRYSLR